MTAAKPYTRIARLYDLLDLPFEYGRYRRLRQIVWTGLQGRILDAGVGTGRNMIYYPTASRMTAIDLSPAMLARARSRQGRLRCPVELYEMDVRQTTLPRAHFDAIISTFLFCVLSDADQLPALMELRRIVKPDGEVRILEYAYSKRPLKRLVMRLWAPWVRWLYGATFDRNTEQYVEQAGFDLVEERFLYQDIIKLLVLKPKQSG